MIYLVDTSGSFLHKVPLVLTVHGGAAAFFGQQLENFYKLVEIAYSDSQGESFYTLNEQARAVTIFQPVFDTELVGTDVCAILEIKNVSDALTSFDEDERGIASVYTPGDHNPKGQEMLTATEARLYRLIFKSRKPVAKRFQRWVFHEVLPCLRRTGKYEMSNSDQQQNTKPTLDELVNFGQKVLAGTRLSTELQKITILRGVQALCPEIAPMAKELVGAIQEISATPDRHLPPTELGKIYADRKGLTKPVRPEVVNRVLEAAGLQRKEVLIKTDTSGKQKRKNIWHLTNEGKQ
ncbi:Bro-N domain-containing protein [Komarekiella sp. 'clone 1']|uniref:Bro-N domain-containing protein n=1 Tax=Komarekiella delphini-convector SJRDD-AB1 TaxID=2593771 RepID=A0AA40T2K8_9NOST|nr:Bro-N domain-containing protein [Komarekiella delphini-convector]MBD6619595.1 Bro-N domain-containing protein [Komarekiella delphini-convector SJRDD-AB1]